MLRRTHERVLERRLRRISQDRDDDYKAMRRYSDLCNLYILEIQNANRGIRRLQQKVARLKARLEKRPSNSAYPTTTATQRCRSDPMPDATNHPAHYTASAVECIDAIRSALTAEEWRGFCKGNVIKYVWRERLKGGREDLKKARWYIDRMLNDE